MPNTSVFPGGVCEPEDEAKHWYEHFRKFGLHRKELQNLLAPPSSNDGHSFPRTPSTEIDNVFERFVLSVENVVFQLISIN